MPIRETTRDEIIGDALKNGHVTWDELLDTGPGKLQGNHDRPLAAAIHALSMDPDEQTGDVEALGGHVSRVDRWLAYEDSQGFVDVIEYDTEQSARVAFAELDHNYSEWLNFGGDDA